MPLVEYVEKNQKEIKGSPKHPLINFTYLFILLFFPTNFGLYINVARMMALRPHTVHVIRNK
jgi:hypothetical protein